MNDMLIFDFIDDTRDDKTFSHAGQLTGWELVIFELVDDDSD